jgi:hypothetical protein
MNAFRSKTLTPTSELVRGLSAFSDYSHLLPDRANAFIWPSDYQQTFIRRFQMNVKYVVDKRESESKRKKLMEDAVRALGTKVKIYGETFEVSQSDESKLVALLTKSGLKYSR